MNYSQQALLALCVLTFASCKDTRTGTEPDPVASVSIASPDGDVINEGETLQLFAEAKNGSGLSIAAPKLVWSSSDNSIAEVSVAGLVSGRGWGMAVITASADGSQDTVRVHVIPADPLLPASSRVVDVAAGLSTTCALTASSVLYCWGANHSGEFGDGSASGQPTPRRIETPVPFSRIFGTQGSRRVCGLDSQGVAYCAGYNVSGELGDGTRLGRSTFTPVLGGLAFRDLATGGHTCGVAVDGTAYCWGSTLGGALGIGPTSEMDILTPAAVSGDLRFSAIGTGVQFTCGLAQGGSAFCWGSAEQLGTGSGEAGDVPRPVADGRVYTDIGSSQYFTCALEQTGAVYCWGKDIAGVPFAQAPLEIDFAKPITDLSVGRSIACGLTADSTAMCWFPRAKPGSLPGKLRFAGISTGDRYMCGRTRGGAVYCWGDNYYGQLGDGTEQDRSRPVRVAPLPGN